MGPTEKLIQKLADAGHPLGRAVTPQDVPELIASLRQRLQITGEELDLSPESLKVLKRKLVKLLQQTREQPLTDEETVHLVSEVTAYLADVLIQHAGGQWYDKAQTLWGTEIIIQGPWTVLKEQRSTSPYPAHFIIGGTAAWAWDTITNGGKPNFHRLYLQARRKRLVEDVSRPTRKKRQ